MIFGGIGCFGFVLGSELVITCGVDVVVVEVTTLVVPVILGVDTPLTGTWEGVVIPEIIAVLVVEIAVTVVEIAVDVAEIAVAVVEIAVAGTWVAAGAIWGIVAAICEVGTLIGSVMLVVVVMGGDKVGRFDGVDVGSTACPVEIAVVPSGRLREASPVPSEL